MKTKSFLLSGLLLATALSSCVVAPVPVPAPGHLHPHPPLARNPHSPYSPGGRMMTPGERIVHGPHHHGGVVVLPPGARRHPYRGVTYHTHGGLWYRPSGSGYVVVPRPY